MANWLHKTTLRYLDSEDPPLAEQHEWIRNPVIPEGCDDWSWCVIDGDSVRAPTTEERASITAVKLGEAKTAKIREIDARTAQLIEGGSVIVNGVAIKTELTNQVSLQALQQLVSLGVATWPQPVSAVGGGTYTITSQADMIRVAGLVATFVMTTKASGRSLRAQVLACTTLAEVAAVEDSR